MMKKILSLMTRSDWDKFVIETVELVLPSELNGTSDFTNGECYIQLSIATHAKFLLRYRHVIECTAPELLTKFDQNPGGFIGRILNDMDHPAYRLWIRAACIDGKLRMWGQPSFATNPQEGKRVLANV
jgi:hypothetical protein